MDSIIYGESKYISALEAGRLIGVSRDYIGRLCRKGSLHGKRIGKFWIVDENSVKNYAYSAVKAKIERRESLVQARTDEYNGKKPSRHNNATPPGEGKGILDRNIPSFDNWHLQKHATNTLNFLHVQTKTPVTFSAAAQIIPPSTAHQFGDLLHKIISLITIFILVFGSYAVIDRHYLTFARDALYNTRDGIAGISKILAYGSDVTMTASRTQQFASAISSGVTDFSTNNFGGAISAVAHIVHDWVDEGLRVIFDSVGIQILPNR